MKHAKTDYVCGCECKGECSGEVDGKCHCPVTDKKKTKVCKECNRELPLSSFYKMHTSPDGHGYYCKSCADKIKIEHTKRNPKLAWCYTTRSHHRSKGFKVTITNEELYNTIKNLDTCELCGCVLDWSVYTKGMCKPNSPSLDRVNSEKELTVDNVMILCHECNSMKRSKSLEELITFCKMVVKKYG